MASFGVAPALYEVQNGTSKSPALRRALVSKSGHFGVAWAPFEIQNRASKTPVLKRGLGVKKVAILTWRRRLLEFKNGASQSPVLKRDWGVKKWPLWRGVGVLRRSKWSLKIASFEAGLGVKKRPFWRGVGAF